MTQAGSNVIKYVMFYLEIAGIHANVWTKIAFNVSIGLDDKATLASIRMHAARDGGKLLKSLDLMPLSDTTEYYASDIIGMNLFSILNYFLYSSASLISAH